MGFSRIDSVDGDYYAEIYHENNNDYLLASYNIMHVGPYKLLGSWLGSIDGTLYTWQDVYNSCLTKFNIKLNIPGTKKTTNGLGSWVHASICS